MSRLYYRHSVRLLSRLIYGSFRVFGGYVGGDLICFDSSEKGPKTGKKLENQTKVAESPRRNLRKNAPRQHSDLFNAHES